MDNQQHKSKKQKLLFQNTDKNGILIGCIIGTFLAITPYLFYLYESVPALQTWDTFLFTYESKGYKDVNTVAWLFTGKAIPLLLLTVWFFSCRHWWYHVLLIPIIMYVYQIFGLFTEDANIDQFQLIYFLPMMAIIIPSIYLIRARMFNKINDASKTMQELEDEFKIKPTGLWGKIKQYF